MRSVTVKVHKLNKKHRLTFAEFKTQIDFCRVSRPYTPNTSLQILISDISICAQMLGRQILLNNLLQFKLDKIEYSLPFGRFVYKWNTTMHSSTSTGDK